MKIQDEFSDLQQENLEIKTQLDSEKERDIILCRTEPRGMPDNIDRVDYTSTGTQEINNESSSREVRFKIA